MNAKILILLITILSLKSSELEIFRPYSKVVESMNECGSVENGLLHRSLILGLAKTDFDLAAKVINNHQNRKISFDRALQKLSDANLVKLTKVFDFLDINSHENINLNAVLRQIIIRDLSELVNDNLQDYIPSYFVNIYKDAFKKGELEFKPINSFKDSSFISCFLPIVFSRDNRYVIFLKSLPRNPYGGLEYEKPVVFDLKLNKIVLEMKHAQEVSSAQFSDDNLLVVTTSRDGVARVWDLKKNNLTKYIDGSFGYGNDNSTPTKCYNFNARESLRALEIRDNESNKVLQTIYAPKTGTSLEGFHKIEFSNNGQYLVTYLVNRVIIWKLKKISQLNCFKRILQKLCARK